MCEATLDANERLFCGVILSGSFTIMQKRKDIILFDDKIRISWHFKSSKRQFQTKIIFCLKLQPTTLQSLMSVKLSQQCKGCAKISGEGAHKVFNNTPLSTYILSSG